jgi:hypothetical protein
MNSREDDLRHSVQALAQPADEQIALFPDFVVVGDELALDFESALERFRADAVSAPAQAVATVNALNAYLEQLSGPQNEDFWLDEARLREDPRWNQVRQLALAVLEAFGWPNVTPKKNHATYVSETKVVHNS